MGVWASQRIYPVEGAGLPGGLGASTNGIEKQQRGQRSVAELVARLTAARPSPQFQNLDALGILSHPRTPNRLPRATGSQRAVDGQEQLTLTARATGHGHAQYLRRHAQYLQGHLQGHPQSVQRHPQHLERRGGSGDGGSDGVMGAAERPQRHAPRRLRQRGR